MQQTPTTPGPHASPDGEIRRFGMFIDNEVQESGSARIDVMDPASGIAWAQVPNASADDVDRAVSSARRAFEAGEWPTYRAADRARFLIRFGELLGEHAEELARLQVRENGKLLREMLGQTKLLPEYFTYYAGLAQLMGGRTTQLPVRDMINYTVREPMGVVAAITPWNSPLLLLTWKLGPALAAGNTVVAKPSEITPVSTLRLAELAAEAGLPPGVFNVVTGNGHPTGTALTSHPQVDKVAFTGSTAVGIAIAEQAAKSLKRVSLELGGKSPNIVFEDADLASAINGLVAGIFGASGQTCMAGSRILVQRSIHDQVLKALVSRADAIRIGDPLDDATEMGTVACEAQMDKVEHYIDVATRQGARLAAGGQRALVAELPNGLFIRPTVFADVTNDMSIARNEVFGPVAAVIPFDDEDDAVAIANDTTMGLAAGVWTNSIQRAHRVAGRLRAGTVWINNYRKTSYASPFGGYKQSGLGRENGPDALDEFTEVKSVWVDTGAGVKDPFNPRA
jgi:(Z)-2-((N-methylformamido)methylene)-5-hydroxybutyrolactone dehydrogenase